MPSIFLQNPYFIVQTSGVSWCFTRKSCDVSEDVLGMPWVVFLAMEHREMSGSMVQNIDVSRVSPKVFGEFRCPSESSPFPIEGFPKPVLGASLS